jgi:hypothetical protein
LSRRISSAVLHFAAERSAADLTLNAFHTGSPAVSFREAIYASSSCPWSCSTSRPILSAALQGGSFLKALTGIGPDGEKQPYHLGHFFMVINPEFFLGEESFRKITGTTAPAEEKKSGLAAALASIEAD